jgi:hypothetical protein
MNTTHVFAASAASVVALGGIFALAAPAQVSRTNFPGS